MESVSYSRLLDLAQGRLSPSESQKLLKKIEKSERLSRAFDLVVHIMDAFDQIESKKDGRGRKRRQERKKREESEEGKSN